MVKINKKELKEIFIQLKYNKIAVEQLYTKYNQVIYAIAFSILKNKQDAEDVVQIVFTKIYNIDINKLPTDKEASWLYTTTKNESINLLRKRKNIIQLEDIYGVESSNNEIDNIINKESYNELISRLNNKEKEIVSLKILADLSFEQIGKFLNEPTSTIKWRYYKAVHTLHLFLSNLAMFIITGITGIKLLHTKNTQDIVQQHITKEDNFLSIENNILDEEMKDLGANSKEKIKSETISMQEKIEDINPVGIGVLGVSTIFLIATIIFFIKIQLKSNKKTSK